MNQELICLASASPRRRELLAQIGVPCDVRPVDVDERQQPGEAPADYVVRIALAKARAAAEAGPDGRLVLGSDTAVVADGEVMGKPADAADARRMLGLLSGRSHDVLTAVAVVADGRAGTALSESTVTFRTLHQPEIDAYVATGEPMDKAGAYAIQGRAAVFVSRLEGSYSGVMGLPLYETAGLLSEFGYELAGRDA